MDQSGHSWIATAKKESTMDYKGRYYMYLHEENGSDAEGHALLDIRWNGEEVARRTLQAMSDVELRRRLRSAKGRS